MGVRTLTCAAMIVFSLSSSAVHAQGISEFDAVGSEAGFDPASSDRTGLDLPVKVLDAALEQSAQPAWYVPASHLLPHDTRSVADQSASPEPATCRSNQWDFSEGLLTCLHQDTSHRYTGFLDFNYYYDTRDFNVLTVNAGAKLPHDFEYFQFANYRSQFGNESTLEDWNNFFTEIHLRRPIAKDSEWFRHLDWTLMWADGSLPEEVGRLGVRWRFQDTPGSVGDFFRDTLKLRYSLTFHVIEDDGSGWQMEHVYRRNFLDGLVYIGGFADHNINGTADSSDWVSETQIGVRLLGGFYAVAEYRYLSFASSSRFKQGVGIGLEYALRFQ